MALRCRRSARAVGLAGLAALVAAAGLWIATGVSARNVATNDFLVQNATEIMVVVKPDSDSFRHGIRFYTGGRPIWHRCATGHLRVESVALEGAVAVASELNYSCSGLVPAWLRSHGPGLHTFAAFDFPRDVRGSVVPGTYIFRSDTAFWVLDGVAEIEGPRPRTVLDVGLLATAASLSALAALLGLLAGALACRGCGREAGDAAGTGLEEAPPTAVVGHVFLEVAADFEANGPEKRELPPRHPAGAAPTPSTEQHAPMVVVVGRPVGLGEL